MLFKSDGREKVWRRKNCELDDKNLTATMVNTMDNGAAGALNGKDGSLRDVSEELVK